MQNNRAFWKNYLANAQFELSIADKTKVPLTWNEINYEPDFNKIYFILDGEGFLEINGQRYLPQPGELYLLPAETKQSYGVVNENTFLKYWCHFTAKLGDLHLFQILKAPVCIKSTNKQELQTIFKQLIYHSRQDTLSSEFRVHALLLQLIANILEHYEIDRLPINDHPSFQKMNSVLNYIETNLDGNVTIEQLAQIANFHPNYFIKVFKEFTSYSPIQYINRRRMEKAKHLLTTTDSTVSNIADTLGMEVAYFSRLFREYTGFTATAYREMVTKVF